MEISADFLRFSKREPADSACVGKIRVNGMWVSLIKPVAMWPKDLLERYEQDLYFLFPTEFRTENYNSKDLVCLCSTITNCSLKSLGQTEKRDCHKYRRGLCVEASVEANECKPLSLGSIARFHGLSKQRVHQIYKSARHKLIVELANDEVMQEYLADIFIGKRSMPTPDEISTFIEHAMHGSSESDD